MKKNLFLLFTVSIFAVNAQAQITIGSLEAPHKGAILELKSDTLGFLPPRVELNALNDPYPIYDHVEGLVVFNTKESTDGTLKTGLYYNSGARWVRLSTVPFYMENWFYMPSIVLSVGQGNHTVNLYDEVKKQFSDPNPVKNPDAPTPFLPALPGATELNYYITGYDRSVFNITELSNEGVLRYTVPSIAVATDSTYINIIFVKK
jgi:hypothetical protein